MGFRGQFSHSLDEKGRLVIPTKFREELGKTFVIAKGYDDCLYAYNTEVFDKFADELVNLPENVEENRIKRRYFLASASDVEMDKQGRFLIPPYLRDAAGIRRDVIIVGYGNKLEIWDEETYVRVTEDPRVAVIARQ